MKDGLYGINMLQLLFGVKNAKELSKRLGGMGLNHVLMKYIQGLREQLRG
ncbi:MAG: hypothetical protein QXI38_04730 [Conexivisphaerales archaeon]